MEEKRSMIQLDKRGCPCPIPVVEAKKALESAEAGTWVEVLVDNAIAVQNLRKLASHKGLKAEDEKRSQQEYAVRIQAAGKALSSEGSAENLAAGKRAGDEDLPELESCQVTAEPADEKSTIEKGTILAVGSDQMGQGDEKLGHMLMKSFIYAVTKQDFLPETILFFNGGARISCEGSESLEYLRELENAGCQILTCGTCLDFYGLKEKLAVGQVTNMYEIVEQMMGAKKTIRL